MAKTKISELDAAAANNTDINSVDVSEGCAPSGINNAIREMGAMLKRMDVGTDALTSPDIDGGSIDGATIGTNSVITDLRVDNLRLDGRTISSTDTDGNITISPNGTGKVNVVGELEADSLDIDGNGTIDGSLTITTADNTAQLIVKSTDDDASVGPLIELYRDSASPAVSDALGRIEWKGKNDLGQDVTYSFIDTFIRDETDTTEDGELRFVVMRDGTTREALMLGESNVVFNEGGLDINFRVESSGNTSMFFLDGGNDTVGIGTGSPTNPLTVRGDGGSGTAAAIRIRDESDQGATFGIENDGDLVLVGETKDFNINLGGTQKFRFKSDGDLHIVDGDLVISTDGHGIDFSATANSSGTNESELLDDFEKGTWVPTGATNSGTAATFGNATGRYQKIGKLVTIYGFVQNIDTSGTTSSSQLRVGGLPFTVDVTDTQGVVSHNSVSFQSSRTQLTVQADASSDALQFPQNGSGLPRTNTDHGDISSGVSDIYFQVTYQTSQ